MDETRPTRRNRFLLWLTEWNLFLDLAISFLILVAVIVQAVIYNAQRRIMNEQREAMSLQSGIMQKSLTLTERSLSLSERAYVGVANLKANLKDREVVIMLENIGRIPADKVSLQAQEYRWTPKHSVSSTFDSSEEVQLFPGKFPMHMSIPLDKFKPEEINGIYSKKEILAVVGTIHYEDGFGKRDATSFAYKYQPPPKEEWIASPRILEVVKRHLKPE